MKRYCAGFECEECGQENHFLAPLQLKSQAEHVQCRRCGKANDWRFKGKDHGNSVDSDSSLKDARDGVLYISYFHCHKCFWKYPVFLDPPDIGGEKIERCLTCGSIGELDDEGVWW